jgi:intracellular sulfur oxidation DsrE/DsrF family protein
MKKHFLFPGVAMLLYFFSSAQNKPQKIVFDFVKSDTADFRIMVTQINNILLEAPYTIIEVVCYSQGLNMLVSNKTKVSKEMEEIQKGFNVSFMACANSMRRMKVDKSQLLPFAKIVPVAMLELSYRQQVGWSYIKAGTNQVHFI